METLGELKVIVGRAVNFHVNYYAVSGKNKFYFSDVPDVDGCDMFIVGGGGDLIETDMDSVCIYGFDEFRSLSDIKRIIQLMEGQKKAYQAYVSLEEVKQKYNGQNKIAKALLKLAYECDEFALPGDLRKDIKEFLGDL